MKHTRLFGSLALSALLITGFSGCGSDDDDTPAVTLSETEAVALDLGAESEAAIEASLVGVADEDKIPFGDGSFGPFERVAIFPTVKDANGDLDHNATYEKVQELAKTFANYVATTDEPASDSDTFKGANWIVGGVEGEPTDELLASNILAIPTKLPINPDFATSTINNKKVSVVEVCNSTYAGQALGVSNVGGDNGTKVPNGIYHTTALPCEVAIYNDEKAIYVDMLNPETIFTLFFTEVFGDAVMENTDFRNAMMALPSQVKSEIYALIYNAFDESASAGEYTKTGIKMGPIYSSMSKAIGIAQQAAPYGHYRYTGTGEEFDATDAQEIAQKLIDVMTVHGTATAGMQEEALHDALPSVIAGTEPSWRSARHEPLKVPGGSWIIETCSPVYAKEALGTGEHHATALPCEIAVFVDPDDNTSINVSFLDPNFMFGALFDDALSQLSDEEKAGFQGIIDNINADLRKMVDYAFENNVTVIDHTTKTDIEPIVY